MGSRNAITHGGFTLIEMLIAISIFSLIVVSLYAGFSVGMDGWRKIERMNAVRREGVLFLTKMERELRNAVVYSPVQFAGESTQVSFCSLVNEKGGKSLKKLTYRLDGETIQCQDENLKDGVSKKEAVAQGVSHLQMQYAVGDEVSGLSWISLYKYSKSIPRSVKVSLVLCNDGKEETFEKIIDVPSGGWER